MSVSGTKSPLDDGRGNVESSSEESVDSQENIRFEYKRMRCQNLDRLDEIAAAEHLIEQKRNQAKAMWRRLANKVIGKIPKVKDVEENLDLKKLRPFSKKVEKSLVKDELKSIKKAKEDLLKVEKKTVSRKFKYMKPQNR